MAQEARFTQWSALVVGDTPPEIEISPDPVVAQATAAAPVVTIVIAPAPVAAQAQPLVPSIADASTIQPVVAVASVLPVSITFTRPPPPPPSRCDHPTQPAYLAQLQQLLPRGPAWTRDPAAVLTALLSAVAAELSCVDDRARALLRESDPRTTLEMLPEWEAALELPDACTGPLATVEARRAAIVQRLSSRGGASPSYIEETLASRGFPGARVLEYAPFVAGSRAGDRLTSPQRAFRAGYGRAGDWLTNNERWLYTWAVEAPDFTFASFHAGSLAGEALRTWGNGALECLVEELQPAHTFVLFFFFRDLRPDPVVATLQVPVITVS